MVKVLWVSLVVLLLYVAQKSGYDAGYDRAKLDTSLAAAQSELENLKAQAS